MPWNEPGGNNRDPWSKRPNDQGPPDLDEVVRKITGKLSGVFGSGGGRPSSGGGRMATGGIVFVLVVAAFIYLLSGIYIIQDGDRGIVLRFGEYVATTTPGPHWHIPYPVEEVETIQFDRIRSAPHKATMLTQDENIVAIDLAVQYRVKDAADYVLQVRDPDTTVGQTLESALREVVGKSRMDFILGEGQASIAGDTLGLMQASLDNYKTGLEVTSVNLQQAQPPEPVQDAFADATKAREDEERYKNEAEAYSNEIIPVARGQAARLEQESQAYMEQVIARSEGEADRFEKLLTEYRKAPAVTRERLYIETVESVLANSNKVMLDVEGGNNLLYLPLDQLVRGGASRARTGDFSMQQGTGSDSLIGAEGRPNRSSRTRETQ